MKFKSLILLIVSLFILFSCDSGVKLNNPNDPNNRISQGMGEPGKECYPNNTCNKGLVCDEESLVRRWKNDHDCEWRTDEWLEASLKSLPRFAAMENTMDTGGLTVDEIVRLIVPEN